MYIEKEKEILQKLEEKEYFLFGQQQDKDSVLNLLEKELLTFPQYANIVIKEQIMLPIWRQRLEPEALKYYTEKIDTERRNAHNFAIGAVKWLNRVCVDLGISKFSNILVEDRQAVANLVGAFIGELYDIGTGKSFDDITYNKDEEYDINTTKRKFREIAEEFEDR